MGSVAQHALKALALRRSPAASTPAATARSSGGLCSTARTSAGSGVYIPAGMPVKVTMYTAPSPLPLPSDMTMGAEDGG